MLKSKFFRAGISLTIASFAFYTLTVTSSISEPSENTVTQPLDVLKPAPLAQRQVVKWAKKLEFLPAAGQQSCKDALDGIGEDVWSPEYARVSKAHLKFLQALNDSQQALSSGRFSDQQKMFAKVASLPSVRTVCESGFNAGHNAMVWLTAKKTTKVLSFDSGIHKYSHEAASFLQKRYPTRLNVTWGYTPSSLSKHRRDHPDARCDVIFVDGGRSAKAIDADLNALRMMVNDRHLLILDDYPTKKSELNEKFAPVWETRKRDGVVAELFACAVGNFRGFSLGHFIS